MSRFGDGSTSLDPQDAIIEPCVAAHDHPGHGPDLSGSSAVRAGMKLG